MTAKKLEIVTPQEDEDAKPDASADDEEARKAVEDFFVADLTLRAIERQTKLARDRRELRRNAVKLAVNELPEIDPEGGWSIDLHRLEVHRVETKEDDVEKAEQVVGISRIMIDKGEDAELKEIVEGKVLSGVKDLAKRLGEGLVDYFKDLAEMLVEGGARGRAVALGVCKDLEKAAEVARDEKAPKPLRFLALQVVTAAKKKAD